MMRFEKLKLWMKELQMEVLLLENPVDIFYLTGLWFSKARLICQARSATLVVDGRYFDFAKQNFQKGKVVLASPEEFKKLFSHHPRIFFDSAFTTVEMLAIWQKQFPAIEWMKAPEPLKQLRLIKDHAEIAALQKAAEVTKKGYHHILHLLKTGISEGEVAQEFEFFCKKHGASKLSFDPIIAFGENSAYPHYHSSHAVKLQQNQVVLIDIGAVVADYAADMTRVIFFGTPDPELERMKQLVVEAQHKAMQMVRPGVCLGTLDEEAREVFKRVGMESLFTHNLGHGIGLQTHEYPSLRFDGPDKDLILQEGMVFTIEPGLYQAGLGGIRWEDTIMVTKTGMMSFYADL